MALPECLAGRYEIRGLLGRGGMGEVYDGWDRLLDRPVAIKLLSSRFSAQEGVLTRFQQEARAAARLASPKVVAVFDIGETDGTPYIVMERLPSRTLADEMSGGPLAPDRVRAILLDMLEALRVAHAAGILHRDIKPSNVLLTEDGTAKIADFGIAKTAGMNLTQTGQFVGTAGYLSPERLNGLPAGPDSDLYSAGIVGYEALCGERPFKADTPLGLIRAIADDPVPSIRSKLPDLDEDLAAAIDKATRRRPEERFQSAEEMIAALGSPAGRATAAGSATVESFVKGGDTRTIDSPRPLGSTGASPTWYQRRSGRWAAVACGALALLFALRPAGDGPDGSPPQATPAPAASEPTQPQALGDTRPVSGVSSIEFLGPGTLILEQTDSGESLTVEAPEELRPLIRTDVAGGRLTLGLDPGTAPAGAGSVIYRARVNELRELKAIGGGEVRASNLSTESFALDNAGSTDVEISGKTGRFSVTLNGSGNLEASTFRAGRVTAELNGSGDAVVFATEELDASLNGSGNLDYLGDPKVRQSAGGSGRVRKKG